MEKVQEKEEEVGSCRVSGGLQWSIEEGEMGCHGGGLRGSEGPGLDKNSNND